MAKPVAVWKPATIAISAKNKAANGAVFTDKIDTSTVRDVPA
jgi:hypothetical protein